MGLDIRLNILKNAGQISEETFIALKNIINMFREKWDINLTEENGSMLITHLSVALERIRKGEFIEGIEGELYGEIKNHCQYEKCRNLLKDIKETAQIEIPESEETFIIMHLCTLLGEN